MDDVAKAVWKHVIREMRQTGVILGADRDVLRAYCEASAGYVRNLRLLLESGPLIRGARGNDLVVNPLHRLVREERYAMLLFARELGLTPSARASLRMDAALAHLDMDSVIGPPTRLTVVNG
jgi:P27 family predicted phage terminase small subunit